MIAIIKQIKIGFEMLTRYIHANKVHYLLCFIKICVILSLVLIYKFSLFKSQTNMVNTNRDRIIIFVLQLVCFSLSVLPLAKFVHLNSFCSLSILKEFSAKKYHKLNNMRVNNKFTNYNSRVWL